MDFEHLFDLIGLAREGRALFAQFHARREELDFANSIAAGFEAYHEGDPAFGSFLEAFSAQEHYPAEVLNLYFYLLLAERTFEAYTRRGIDPEVFGATLGDISIYCALNKKENGVYGIPQRIYRRWLRRYFECRIYQLGRLRFELAPSIYDTQIEDVSVSKGDTILSVHIPGGDLSDALCEDSYTAARAFFKKHYGMERPVFFCYSWLIQPWLAEVLPRDSRIVRFQSHYKVIDFVDDPGDMLLWVFPKNCENSEDYPEETALRRLTKERVRRGDIIGYGSGVRL